MSSFLSIGFCSPFASLALSSPNGYLFDIVQLHSYRFHVEHFRSISSFSALPLFWWALPRFRSPKKKDLAEGSTYYSNFLSLFFEVFTTVVVEQNSTNAIRISRSSLLGSLVARTAFVLKLASARKFSWRSACDCSVDCTLGARGAR